MSPPLSHERSVKEAGVFGYYLDSQCREWALTQNSNLSKNQVCSENQSNFPWVGAVEWYLKCVKKSLCNLLV